MAAALEWGIRHDLKQKSPLEIPLDGLHCWNSLSPGRKSKDHTFQVSNVESFLSRSASMMACLQKSSWC